MRECRLDVTPAAAAALALAYYLDDTGLFSAAIPAILCHEMGHWIAVRLLGGRVTGVRIELAGLCMESTVFHDRTSEVLALAAGPIAGLLWAAAAWKFGGNWGIKSSVLSLTLTLYNLLPALPLDGGRILLALTGSMPLMRWSGGVTAAILLCLAVRYSRWMLFIPAVVLGLCAVKR